MTASTGGSSSLGWLGSLAAVPLLAAFAVAVKRRAQVRRSLTLRVSAGDPSTAAARATRAEQNEGDDASGKPDGTRDVLPTAPPLGEEKVGLDLPLDLPSPKEPEAVRHAVMVMNEFRV